MALRRQAALAANVLLLAFAAATSAATVADVPPINAMCPVLPDEPADPAITVEFHGRTIGFCCPRCHKQFLADPGAFQVSLPSLVAAVAEPHDHAHDHAPGEATFDRFVRFVGKLHPVLVHFPIALLIAAAAAELLGMVTGRAAFEHAARFSTLAGAIGAVSAAPIGWAAAASARYPSELADALSVHRWLGTSTAALAVAAAVLSMLVARSGSRQARFSYRIVLAVTVIVVSIAGHFGATLVYGPDYVSW